MIKRASKSIIIAETLAKRIQEGVYPDKLPSSRAVSKEFNVALMTAVNALKLLSQRGMVSTVPGIGNYVQQHKSRTIKIAGGIPFHRECLTKWVGQRFPGTVLEFVPKTADAELIVCATFSPVRYEEMFAPFPHDELKKLKDSRRYWELAFDLHKRGSECYGIPSFFSPLLLAWDKKLMAEIDPLFNPYTLTWEKLQEYRSRLNGIPVLGGANFAFAWFLTLLCNSGKTPFREEDFEHAVNLYRMLPVSRETHTLFRIANRYNCIDMERSGRLIDVAPMPLFASGTRYCHLTSETLMVRYDAEDLPFLQQIRCSLLEEGFQQLLQSGLTGIAPERDIAIQNIGGHVFRDDVFFSEMKNMIMCRKEFHLDFAVEREMRLALNPNKADLDELKANVYPVLKYLRNEKKRNRMLLEPEQMMYN